METLSDIHHVHVLVKKVALPKLYMLQNLFGDNINDGNEMQSLQYIHGLIVVVVPYTSCDFAEQWRLKWEKLVAYL